MTTDNRNNRLHGTTPTHVKSLYKLYITVDHTVRSGSPQGHARYIPTITCMYVNFIVYIFPPPDNGYKRSIVA